jgi:hypothetical protein
MEYKDIEEFLDEENENFNREEVKKNRRFAETMRLYSMLGNLPDAKAPSGFESRIYERLGISHMPLFKRILILAGLSLFSLFIYIAGISSFRFLSPRITLTSISQFISQVCGKWGQIVSLIRVGQHLKYIFLSFTNPCFFVALVFVSMVMMMILILLSGGLVRKEMVDEVENI